MFATAKDNNVNVAKDNMTNEGGTPLPHNVKESVHRMKNDSRDAAATLKGDVEDVARQAGQHVRELADEAGHNVADITQSMTAKIRDNPVQSSFIALGVGVVMGMLYRR